MYNINREANHIGLVGGIIGEAIEEEGLGYLKTAGGRMWCSFAGLDPKVVAKFFSKTKRKSVVEKPIQKFDRNAFL